MTHTDLVNAAYKWVLKNAYCGAVLKELYAAVCNGEVPDIIGFGNGGLSVLIECKMSRSDFTADKQKPFRICPDLGMGTQRFYCCPEGLLEPEDLPDRWGLLWVNGNLKARCIHKNYKGNCDIRKGFDKNLKAEWEIMYSVLRRLQKRSD